MYEHYIEDKSGDLIEVVALCSDACHRLFAPDDYQGWNGCHETEFTTFCEVCKVVIPGEDSCSCQGENVVVNRFTSSTGEKCKHGNWIQLAA